MSMTRKPIRKLALRVTRRPTVPAVRSTAAAVLAQPTNLQAEVV